MLGEKPGKRHDAELRPKDIPREDVPPEAAPGATRGVFGQSPGGPPHFLAPDSDQEPALPLYILLSATVRRFPFRLTQARGYDHRSRRVVQELQR